MAITISTLKMIRSAFSWSGLALGLVACVSASPAALSVPYSLGRRAASTACRMTGAWTESGEAVDLPQVSVCIVAVYPDDMRAAGQVGEVLWRITVDSTGAPVPSSFSVDRSTDPRLTRAVSRAAPYIRFAPLPRNRTVVELPTTFQIAP